MVEMMEVIKKEQEEDGTAQRQGLEEGGAKKIGGGGHEEEPSPSGKVKKKARKQGVSDPQRKRACVDCTRRCSRVHGRAAASSSCKAPPAPAAALTSFFKVMTGSFSEKLDVPPRFAKNIPELADTNVYLEDAFGLRWRVYLCARDGRLSFGHGWRNFVLDHTVAVGEFLVFRHISRSVFAVQIFAKSACERLHLCEKNKRQSKKRKKPGEKASSDGDRTAKASKKSSEDKDKKSSKKKQRACDLLDGDQDRARGDQDHMVLISTANTQAANCGGSDFGTYAEPTTPLAMMDLDDEITDDIFLTADAYEFETDLCIPEEPGAFPVDNGIGMEAPVTHGETSGFSCAEMIGSRNCDSSVGVGLCHGEKSAGLKNKQMADARVITSTYTNAPVLDMDMTALPSNALSEIREEKPSPRIDAAAPSSECATGNCKKDTDYKLMEFPSEGNQVDTKEAIVLVEDSSAEQDEDLQIQECTGWAAAEIISGGSKPGERGERRQKRRMQPAGNHESASRPSSRKLRVAAPPADQTWLELPCRMPVLPGRKKQGRKVVVLEDPGGRRWPVLYLCTPTFSGFVAGWADVRAENGLREGDACELELRRGSYSELALRVLGAPGSTSQ
ncbi:B3 domain-containing protein Os01g0905400-like isoform X1 [Aegilops tauschii subsp. strangulata]|uniref:TF-B3 domain-containing protein n=1 Tax=Aegilops tauschii subsp. strangulata TaxID=200361 RepID=A0A453G322_AEGTS|nr:B3 domain-containing protein Os01g0905400-like isoform X1 [Aegilops tauschii subsp. strangulata]